MSKEKGEGGEEREKKKGRERPAFSSERVVLFRTETTGRGVSHDRLVFVSHCPVGLCEGVREQEGVCVCVCEKAAKVGSSIILIGRNPSLH